VGDGKVRGVPGDGMLAGCTSVTRKVRKVEYRRALKVPLGEGALWRIEQMNELRE
jgi:hypothetical protein